MKRMHKAPRESAMGLGPEDLRKFRKILLARKAELLDRTLTLEDEARLKGKEAGELSAVPFHPADLGTDSFEQSLSLALLENQSSALREVDLALERMDLGTYGSCDECGSPLGKARLRALPQATLCRACKSVEESLN